MTQGYVALVLHAHLPFVRHPDRDDYLEERWLFEAITECYLPLIDALEHLEHDRVPFRLTLSLSPTLMAMLDDPLLQRRYQAFLEAGVDLAEREVALTNGRWDHGPALFYQRHLIGMLRLYMARNRDVNQAFHRLAKAGYLDLITCGATHGFLPLYQHQPEAVRAQISVAAGEFHRRFGHPPRGLWLPECGYFPGVERFLQEAGIEYCFVDTHAVAHARPAPRMATFAHGWAPGGVAIFGRDLSTSKQVWSANEGYPGDPAYREFYRDIGWDRDLKHLGKLAGPNGIRTFSGFKYHRVTGPTEFKEVYDRWAAEQTAKRHAAHFVHDRGRQAARVRGLVPDGPPPLVVAPYDAELFGHWWFEGPYFLEQVARQAQYQDAVRFITPGDYLDWHRAGQGVFEPSYSSWGYQGYADFWVDGANHWMYRHVHGAGRRMINLARKYAAEEPAPIVRRALNQAVRELLLAQASDWAFILRTGTATDYAWRRFHAHAGRFHRISDDLQHGREPDEVWLSQVEAADNLFPDLDFRIYAAK
ncbi:MAG TPA: 1,4-alpha-glucan branching protein domain-containing protein [Symbiobacteriaceae bacterium]|nr:1,4-alpha-glucan branching protein domain-containing protein [Symbiobacteriaceae bacterium]